MSSNLAILDAEQFVGTAGIHLAGKGGIVKKAHPVHADDGPRKRAKRSTVTVVTEVGEEDGGDEKSTRARGRPRLDTKDQTAADVGSMVSYVQLCHLVIYNATFFAPYIAASNTLASKGRHYILLSPHQDTRTGKKGEGGPLHPHSKS